MQELKLLLHRSTLLRTQGQKQDYLDAMITMISMLLKVQQTRSQLGEAEVESSDSDRLCVCVVGGHAASEGVCALRYSVR